MEEGRCGESVDQSFSRLDRCFVRSVLQAGGRRDWSDGG